MRPRCDIPDCRRVRRFNMAGVGFCGPCLRRVQMAMVRAFRHDRRQSEDFSRAEVLALLEPTAGPA
jgi:hypothetical protein